MSVGSKADVAGERIRVLVVEDHTLMVDALVRRLEVDAGMTVVGVVSTDSECLVTYRTEEPDLVLCDIGLRNDASGIDLTAKLTRQYPDARVLMYSGYTDHDLVQSALEAGAVGYIRKTASLPELIECLTTAAAGGRDVFDRTTMMDMIGVLKRTATATTRSKDPDGLTRRERQVLELMVGGTTATKDIAAALFVAPQTAKSHVERLLTKLEVPNRTAAVTKALKEGMVSERLPGTIPKTPAR